MTVGKDKVRTLISINKELKNQLQELAEKDNRSFNNYVINVLINHVENEKRGK